MGVVVVGLSHKTAPIQMREHLTIPQNKLGLALDELKGTGRLQETVVLSTCNRLEVYARPTTNRTDCAEAISQFFRKLYDTPDLKNFIYQFESYEAVNHLFKVAAGLDSLVVGETDVLGQVKSAYLFAQKHGTTGKITNVLFQRALFVGKSVRTKTNISEGSSSVGAVAVQLAERIFGNLGQHRVLLLGAGKMAEVTARHLLSQKAKQLVILNRTVSKAEELAKLLNGRAGSMDQLERELIHADIVICSTAADKPIVTTEMMKKINDHREMRSLYFVDIAVPRNVEPGVHELDNVYVYNIDDLKSLVEENMQQRREQIGSASSMVTAMANEFYEWLKATLEGKDRPLRHTIIHEN